MRAEQTPQQNCRPASWMLLRLILGSLPLWIGCEGCRQRDQDGAAQETAAASEYTFGGAEPIPQGQSLAQSGVKPGHWFTITESIRSNRNDQRGTLRHSIELVPPSASEEAFDAGNSITSSRQPELLRLPLQAERPAVLPKGRTKRLDSRLLAGSPGLLRRGTRGFINGQFLSRSHATFLDTGRRSVSLLQPQEYFFIVLTERPERFAWLQSADWIRPPRDDTQFHIDVPANYRLIVPKAEGLLALPEIMFDLTSTAVVLWDDLEPAALTPEQARAIVDWVQFGGRLIVNGPAAGTQLSRSRFGDLLPLDIQGSAELNAAAVEELLRFWSVQDDNTTLQQIALVHDRTARIAADGQVHPAATPLRGTSEMVLARGAGRGQVVLTRFDLTSDWLRAWRSRDSFFNAALLGRPRRTYVTNDGSVLQVHASGTQPGLVDPAANTSFRLLARDGRLLGDAASEFASHPTQGYGGWRDDSDAATLVLQTLRSESGVAIPPRRFVTQSLGIYLLILVPLNYLLFRLLGRLEWAWLAVPVIGMSGAAWIARGASLDIGFARSRTEIALVELQGGYSRGHVTRFISLYNSLSRQYDFVFDSPDAVAAPLGILGQIPVDDEHRETVTLKYGYAEGPILDAVPVASNRTRIFHTEQMIDLGGAIELQDRWLLNGSSLNLRDAWIVRKDDDGQLQAAAIGTCDAHSRRPVRWSAAGSASWPSGMPLQAESLLRPLGRGEPLAPGSARLIARCEDPMPGLQVVPESPQQSFSSVVVVHLAHPTLSIGEGDSNLLPDNLERRRQLMLEDALYDLEQMTPDEVEN